MSQVHAGFIADMLKHCERGEHPPLTVWEAQQLLTLAQRALVSAPQASQPPQGAEWRPLLLEVNAVLGEVYAKACQGEIAPTQSMGGGIYTLWDRVKDASEQVRAALVDPPQGASSLLPALVAALDALDASLDNNVPYERTEVYEAMARVKNALQPLLAASPQGAGIHITFHNADLAQVGKAIEELNGLRRKMMTGGDHVGVQAHDGCVTWHSSPAPSREPVGIVQAVGVSGIPRNDSRGVEWLRPVAAGTKLYAAPAPVSPER